jgi:hypothetical protein
MPMLAFILIRHILSLPNPVKIAEKIALPQVNPAIIEPVNKVLNTMVKIYNISKAANAIFDKNIVSKPNKIKYHVGPAKIIEEVDDIFYNALNDAIVSSIDYFGSKCSNLDKILFETLKNETQSLVSKVLSNQARINEYFNKFSLQDRQETKVANLKQMFVCNEAFDKEFTNIFKENLRAEVELKLPKVNKFYVSFEEKYLDPYLETILYNSFSSAVLTIANAHQTDSNMKTQYSNFISNFENSFRPLLNDTFKVIPAEGITQAYISSQFIPFLLERFKHEIVFIFQGKEHLYSDILLKSFLENYSKNLRDYGDNNKKESSSSKMCTII